MSDNRRDNSNNDLLRQRGWSIHSDATEQGDTKKRKGDSNEKPPPSPKRARVESNASYPSIATSDDNSSGSELFPTDNNTNNQKNDHRPGIAQNGADTKPDDTTGQSDESQNDIRQVAQARLSKWAARLFDPNRPRGLIEPPQTIPLNDEFLQAFGKREKEHDQTLGRTLEIDHRIEDDESTKQQQQLAEQSISADANGKDAPANKKPSKKAGRKVKINNLKYTTTKIKLQAECSKFGLTEEVNLILDDNDKKLNKGRAYVTFQTVEGADGCIVGLAKIDGRRVTVMRANTKEGGTTARRIQQQQGRYWGGGQRRDISTKCYRCGQVGHMEADCNNEPTAKPCPLCAGIGHDLRSCPIKAVCFNCGTPGHVSRECPRPRGLPPRRVCTACLQPDHTVWQCQGILFGANDRRRNNQRPRTLPGMDQVECMVCGQTGHYLCQDMKWFFGLEGVSCFNCGRPGHLGIRCDRPNLDVCSRSDEVAVQEVERASAVVSMEDHPTGTRRGQTSDDPHRGRGGRFADKARDDKHNSQRAKSMPPQERRRNNR